MNEPRLRHGIGDGRAGRAEPCDRSDVDDRPAFAALLGREPLDRLADDGDLVEDGREAFVVSGREAMRAAIESASPRATPGRVIADSRVRIFITLLVRCEARPR